MNRTDNRRMSSIARQINLSFWVKRLGAIITMDIIIVGLIFATYFVWCEKSVGGDVVLENGIEVTTSEDIRSRHFESEGSQFEAVYVIEMNDGEEYRFYMYEDLEIVIPAAIVLGVFQFLHLIFSAFGTSGIRRKLKPLNELAKRAEYMSNMAFDYNQYNAAKFEQLEHAIENISPDSPDAVVSTGDSELASIEIALNNLLKHMRESQLQQARFVSDASHELRTPIAVIQGYVNMLDRWGKEDESVLNESIEALKSESEHMKELVEQLLFLARGDSGRNHLNKVEIDMSEIMREVWEEATMIDEKHRYELVDNTDATAKQYFIGDVAMIKQSARIFLQNAAKYSPEDSTITIKVQQRDGRISYIIQDEGIGMNEADLSHIFERFYRSDKARNGETGGSGLGLSIAKWIVDAHDGAIDVISRTDLGTRFTVSFDAVSKSE